MAIAGRPRWQRWASASGIGFLAACFSPTYPGFLPCSETEACPSDQTCIADQCIPDATRVERVAVGVDHSCALFDSGTVRCWGAGSSGRLAAGGDRTIGDDEAPSEAPLVILGARVVDLDGGEDHTCAVLEDGTVRCWGNNGYGQLGTGDTEDVGDDEDPRDIPALEFSSPAVAVAASGGSSCALLEDGTVECWGSNELGALGYGDPADRTSPGGPVPIGGTASQITAGHDHMCVLLDDGRVRCWGEGEFGAHGHATDENIGDDETPADAGDVDVGGVATAVVAGYYNTCVILDGGDVRCWGNGGYSGLAYGCGERDPIGDDEAPAQSCALSFDEPVEQLAAGVLNVCARLESGTVRCWGRNDDGQLGYGHDDDEPDATQVEAVELGGRAIHVDGNDHHFCAVLKSGEVRCWGAAGAGLGTGTSTPRDIGDDEPPSEGDNVALDGAVTSLSAGEDHTCALRADGTARCWGTGWALGTGWGSWGGRRVPAVLDTTDAILQLAGGDDHACGRFEGGVVRCWGAGSRGRLGNGDTQTVETIEEATEVALAEPATDLTANDAHTCALLESGAVQCWGDGADGRLGYGNTDDIGDDETLADVGTVDLGAIAVQLTTGETHTCALLGDGGVLCWGEGDDGRLGHGSEDDIGDDETPASVGPVPLGGVAVQVAAAFDHTCARLDDGSVRCWGRHNEGRLGNGSDEDIGDDELASDGAPVDLGGVAIDLDAGDRHTCVVLEGGGVRCWGDGTYGRLGYGSTANLSRPVTVGDVDLGATATQIVTGEKHTCALMDNGLARCWGDSRGSRLGALDYEDIGDNETPASVPVVEVL